MIITPLISAETGAGAIGCARGSQLCIGITPAFVPMPTSAAIAIAICRPEPCVDRAARAESAGVGCEQHRDPRAGTGEMRDREVEEHGAASLFVAARDEDDRRGQQRHQLPACEERERVARAHHLGEHQHERDGEQRSRASAPCRFEVARRERERGRGDETEHAEEERRQPVDTEARRERPPVKSGAERRAGCERPEAEAAERRGGERLNSARSLGLELSEKRLLARELSRQDVARHGEEVEGLLVGDVIEDARSFAAG